MHRYNTVGSDVSGLILSTHNDIIQKFPGDYTT